MTSEFKIICGNGQGSRQLVLVYVVQVEMNIPERVHEFAELQPHDLGDHHGHQGVRRDVEGDTEKRVFAGKAGG